MTYNYKKSDNTLKMQLVRMQLETIAYARIKRERADETIIEQCATLWLSICNEHDIVPANSFHEEFAEFEKESLLKFAPEQTYINMETKAVLTLEKMGIKVDL